MQLGTPAESGSCRGVERGVRLGMGPALVPMALFGVRALWGVGSARGSEGRTGPGWRVGALP